MSNTLLESGEFLVWVTYDAENECAFYEQVENSLRCSFWIEKGISTAIMFVDIPGGILMPGQSKEILVYTIDVEYAKKLIKNNNVHWGSTICSLGTMHL